MSFAKRLAEERAAAGLTHRDLGRLARVSHTTVMRYESGELDAASSASKSLADALGLSVEDLFDPDPVFVDVHMDRNVPELERTARGGRRIAMWPKIDDRHAYRVRLLALPDMLKASSDAGVSTRVEIVAPSPCLTVYVSADTRHKAISIVLRDAVSLGSCPPVSAERTHGGWIARLRNVPEGCSLALQQRIPMSAPHGLYVPTK